MLNIVFSSNNKGNVENSVFKAAPCEMSCAVYIFLYESIYSDSVFNLRCLKR